MAAISAVLFSQLKAGDAVVLPVDGYQVLPRVREQLTAYGIEVRTAPTGGDAQLEVLDGAKLLWIETPSNPGLDVCDVRRLVAAAHAQGTLVAVDNTLATPLGQRPLELGADFSVASGTKMLTGHGDILLGYVTALDADLMAPVRRWRKIVGAIPGPMEAWLAHRSLATLQLRADRQNANALVIAEALRGRPEVTGLRYPGTADDPSHKIASQQMRRFGCVVSFTLPTRSRADRFLDALRLVDDATSFGGVRSTAERRGRWGGDAVPEGFIRFSAGAEDPEDLVAMHGARSTNPRSDPLTERPVSLLRHTSRLPAWYLAPYSGRSEPPLVARTVPGSAREEPREKAKSTLCQCPITVATETYRLIYS